MSLTELGIRKIARRLLFYVGLAVGSLAAFALVLVRIYLTNQAVGCTLVTMSDTQQAEPKTLQQAIIYFSDPDRCLAYLVARRWPTGVICPTCGRTDVRFLANQRKWQCKSVHHHRQFSIKVGTIFEDSPLGLDKWLTAAWTITNDKNGISSYEVARALGVTQKTARSEEHTSELQSPCNLVCRLLLEKKKKKQSIVIIV